MRENKYDSLLNVSIVILIVSTVMLGITGYNIFFKSKSTDTAASGLTRKESVRDSLRKVYSNTVKNIDNNLQVSGNSTIDKDVQLKFGEMSILRSEIDSLLRQHGSEADLSSAKIKIEELQQRVFDLENRWANAENENKRLQTLLNKLISSDKPAAVPVATTSEPQNTRAASLPPSPSPSIEKPVGAAGASVASLHFFAVTDNKSVEEETTLSGEAEKIVGSFLIKNVAARSGAEVMVVVLQPDGKVVKNSVWESGTFDTREGKKVYSRKIYFDAGADEKQLNFSLTPDKFLKGDYTMQIWFNGNMVGKMTKTLS